MKLPIVRQASGAAGGFARPCRLAAALLLCTLLPPATHAASGEALAGTRSPLAESSFRLSDGATLACYRRPGHPTLVLIPGTGSTQVQFHRTGFVEKLSPSLGVLIIEMRGRGRSWPPPPPEKATVEQYARDVLEVVAGTGLDAWYISGKSLGGMICLEIAGQNPAGLRGAIPLEGWVHHAVAAEAFGEDLPAKTKAAKPKDVPPGWTEEQELALITMWRRWTGGERAVGQIRGPVLAVVGDRGLSPRPARQLLRFPEKPNIQLHWVTGADHDVLAPRFVDEVARAVNAFVARVEADAAR
ncbi:MAG: alpha/beta hydrolase [Opitutaceae bacterium]|nr:alpha/beta hydrolase [Opitutaceae bacterium]